MEPRNYCPHSSDGSSEGQCSCTDVGGLHCCVNNHLHSNSYVYNQATITPVRSYSRMQPVVSLSQTANITQQPNQGSVDAQHTPQTSNVSSRIPANPTDATSASVHNVDSMDQHALTRFDGGHYLPQSSSPGMAHNLNNLALTGPIHSLPHPLRHAVEMPATMPTSIDSAPSDFRVPLGTQNVHSTPSHTHSHPPLRNPGHHNAQLLRDMVKYMRSQGIKSSDTIEQLFEAMGATPTDETSSEETSHGAN